MDRQQASLDTVDRAGWTMDKCTHVCKQHSTLLDRFEFVPLILMIHLNQKINATEIINMNLNLNQKFNSTKCSKKVERKTRLLTSSVLHSAPNND